MKQPEYIEGLKAWDNFEHMATGILKALKAEEGKRARSLAKQLANASRINAHP
jgi:hypothetical protein